MTPTKKASTPTQKNISDAKVIFIIFAFINLVCAGYVLLSKNFYYWSTAESWNISIKIAQGAFHPNLWGEIYKSITTMEVNYLSALPSALFVLIFGQSRLAYILSIANFYAVPIFILIYYISKKIGKSPIVTLIMIFFALPPIMYMVFMGFAEIGGVAIGLLCMYLYLCTDLKPLYTYITIGFLLTLAIVWSHAYIFFAAAFISSMIIDSIISKKSIANPIISLLIVVTILALFFREYVSTRIISLYGNTSQNLNIQQNLKFVLRYIGLILLVSLIYQSIKSYKNGANKHQIFLWSNIIICFITLISTRTHGQLHILAYLPGIIVLSILAIKQIENIKSFYFASLLAIVQLISVLMPRVQPKSVDEIKSYSPLPTFSISAKHRSDFDEILTLKGTLDTVIPDGEYLGVLAYSDMLNPDLINNSQISANSYSSRRDYIAFTIPYFDNATPDISPLCNANYMLVATPLQSSAQNQHILSAAVDSFTKNTDIARAYSILDEYTTRIGGIEIKLFKRTRTPFDYERKEFLMKLYN